MTYSLIDADTIYFRAVKTTLKTKGIRDIIDNTMLDIMGQNFSSDHEIAVAVKGRGNFRKKLYSDYKSNRPALPPEEREALNYAHNYMKEKWGAIEATEMEADDLVAIWAYESREDEIPYVICGIDKDLKQIPGNHYNYNKRTREFIDDDTAHHYLMVQCLTGDTSDNIPGIKGIGPVKANKILSGVNMDRRWSRVRAAWRGHKSGDPTLSYKLLRMLTSWDDLDEIRKECERKKIECSTPGRSTSESTANPSRLTLPTSGSEEEM